MFGRRRKDAVDNLIQRGGIDGIFSSIGRLERRIIQLECPHKEIEHQTAYANPPASGLYFGWSVCKKCHKVLEQFATEQEFLKAKCDMAEVSAREAHKELRALDD